MSYKRVAYFLFQPHFFMEGICGRTSHALGFARGMVDNKKDVHLYSGDIDEIFLPSIDKINFHNLPVSWIIFFIHFCKNIILEGNKGSLLVFRWRPVLALLIPILLFFRNSVSIEFNSLTGVNSGNILIKFFAYLSVFLFLFLFKCHSVSRASKTAMLSIWCKANIFVLPNGLAEFPEYKGVFHNQPIEEITFVYFGTKQSYYDFDYMTQKLPKLISKKGINTSVLLLGTSKKIKKYKIDENINVRETEKMGHKEIVKVITSLKNPVLMLISDESEMAKLGHPTKLFEYLTFGLPILVSNHYADLVEEHYVMPIEKNNDVWIESFLKKIELEVWPVTNANSKARRKYGWASQCESYIAWLSAQK